MQVRSPVFRDRGALAAPDSQIGFLSPRTAVFTPRLGRIRGGRLARADGEGCRGTVPLTVVVTWGLKEGVMDKREIAAAAQRRKEQTDPMSKEIRLSIVEVMMLDKLTLRDMQAKLLEDHGESISHVTLAKDVTQIKDALDLEKPGWDELSEEELLRETVRRGFSDKDRTVSVKEGLAAKKDLVHLLEAKAAGETFSLDDLPEHERQYPMTAFEIELAHMPTDKLKAWMLEQLATLETLPDD